MDEIIIVIAIYLLSISWAIWILSKRINGLLDSTAEMNFNTKKKFKGVGETITKLSLLNKERGEHYHNMIGDLTDKITKLEEELAGYSGQASWLAIEISNLDKAIRDVNTELHGDDMPETIQEDVMGMTYVYDKGLQGHYAYLFARLEEVQESIDKYHKANQSYHTSIGKQIATLKDKINSVE